MIGPYRIEGYVIASADGMIADATGVMPLALQLDADKVYFEDELEHVDGGGPWPPLAGDPAEDAVPPPADPDAIGRRGLRARSGEPARAASGTRPAPRFAEALEALGVEPRNGRRHRRTAGLQPVPRPRLRRLSPLPGGRRSRSPTACRSSSATASTASPRRASRPPGSRPGRPSPSATG